MDFTLKKYEEFLSFISKHNLKIYGILDWKNSNPDSGIIIRHDVDRKANNSLKMAELEAKYNIKTTYYFRITKASFKPEIIKKIADLGHEIGYHYEDLAIAKGNFQEAKKLFADNLTKLNKHYHIKTAAMHGRPMSKHDSRDLWKKFSINDFGLEAEAFLDIDYTDIYYFTDTGRTWSNKGANIRDKVVSDRIAEIKSTDDLINFIKKNQKSKIAIVAHPERWSDNFIEHLIIGSKDLILNTIKRFLMLIR